MSRRDEVLAAAVEVTAAGGVRALTHRAVDQHGGLPAGTASNYFRSRSALKQGTTQLLADVMAGVIGAVGSAPVTNSDELAQALGNNLANALGPGRVLATATAALFTEAAIDPSLHAAVQQTNQLWCATLANLLRAAGVSDSVELRASCLLSYGNGLVVDQLALRDPAFDPVAAMRLGIRGFCS